MPDTEKDQRTEQASERRLDRAFEEGEVPVGRDLVAGASILGALLALAQVSGPLRAALVGAVRKGIDSLALGADPATSAQYLPIAGYALLIAGSAASAAIVATMAQTRGGFWPHLALPNFERLGGGRIGRLFSLEGLADLGIAALKVTVIFAAIWGVWRVRFLALEGIVTTPASTLLDAAGIWLRPLANRLGLTVLFLAGMDLAVTRYRFASRMKMTQQETKREAREDEGDPMIRGRRRRRHRELSRNRLSEVAKADAVVVNPTHIAVAIRYRKDDGAPRVVAKGKGHMAETIRDLARMNGVPIVENVPLARLLYKRVKVGKTIPADTYKAVAAILAYVYRVTRPSAASRPTASALGAGS
jgi:flagellar biosynthesis protein FlhB